MILFFFLFSLEQPELLSFCSTQKAGNWDDSEHRRSLLVALNKLAQHQIAKVMYNRQLPEELKADRVNMAKALEPLKQHGKDLVAAGLPPVCTVADMKAMVVSHVPALQKLGNMICFRNAAAAGSALTFMAMDHVCLDPAWLAAFVDSLFFCPVQAGFPAAYVKYGVVSSSWQATHAAAPSLDSRALFEFLETMGILKFIGFVGDSKRVCVMPKYLGSPFVCSDVLPVWKMSPAERAVYMDRILGPVVGSQHHVGFLLSGCSIMKAKSWRSLVEKLHWLIDWPLFQRQDCVVLDWKDQRGCLSFFEEYGVLAAFRGDSPSELCSEVGRALQAEFGELTSYWRFECPSCHKFFVHTHGVCSSCHMTVGEKDKNAFSSLMVKKAYSEKDVIDDVVAVSGDAGYVDDAAGDAVDKRQTFALVLSWRTLSWFNDPTALLAHGTEETCRKLLEEGVPSSHVVVATNATLADTMKACDDLAHRIGAARNCTVKLFVYGIAANHLAGGACGYDLLLATRDAISVVNDYAWNGWVSLYGIVRRLTWALGIGGQVFVAGDLFNFYSSGPVDDSCVFDVLRKPEGECMHA
jgi:hypothetical protein